MPKAFQLLAAGVMMEAIEMGLFDTLETEEGFVTPHSFASKHGYDVDITERLFDVLSCSGLLEKEISSKGSYEYRNTSGTRKYLTKSKLPTLLNLAFLEETMVFRTLEKLPDILKSGKRAMNIMNGKPMAASQQQTGVTFHNAPAQILNPMGKYNKNTEKPDIKASKENETKDVYAIPTPSSPHYKAGQMADLQMQFMLSMDGIAASCASAIVQAFDLFSHRIAVDLGGGSGRIANEFANMFPEMEVIVFDLPPVVHAAQKQFQHHRNDRISFVEGDMLVDSLPKGDLYILGHVLHGFSKANINTILKKIFDKLPRGGSLLVLEKVLSDDKTAPDIPITNNLVLSMITEGRERTIIEYRKLLMKHGFKNTKMRRIEGFNYYDAILAKKPF
ncbi:hypothetical protein CHS0354_001267 [Potamilus streckersoni]|uniref:Acetylserotonin O-methyltransferase n=1 Tax=Potamilus streckersoni TaxID=2493646 RepID=A0AAE0S7K3_9BIVA|nr:hypothetical protein CHS0354_001267 [Potamilus streckersoni]